MIKDRTENKGEAAAAVQGPVMMVNLFTAKPGMVDKFIEEQTNEYLRLKGQIEGFLGNRLGRSVSGDEIVNVAVFDSLASYNAWRDSDLFREHGKVIAPYVQEAAPGMYQILYAAGEL